MKNCDGCGRSVDQCCCPKFAIERHFCGICTHEGVRSEMVLEEDGRGFVNGWHCKDIAACAKRCA